MSATVWAGAGGFGPVTAHAAPQTYYFHGTTADQANRTAGTPTATFSTAVPTGTTDILQTGDDPVANEAVPENPFTIYWESTALTGTLNGPMTFDWWWSASPADLALADAIDVNVFADPTGTTGTLISGTSGINLPLTVGATPVENHTTVTVSGTVTTKLLIQVRQHFSNEGTTNTVHYDSTSAPSSFTVGATVSTPTPSVSATPAPTVATGGPDTVGTQMFHNYPTTIPPRTPTSPPGVTFLIGEPSIGSNWITNNIMYQGDLSTYQISFDNAKPPNATWHDRSAPSTDQVTLDARLITDHNSATSNRTIVDQLLAGQSAQAYSDTDGGTTDPPTNAPNWASPPAGGGFPSGPDHESTGSGPYHAGTPGLPSPAYSHAVYYCAQAEVISPQPGFTAFCARSDTGGASYGPGIPVYQQTQCGGLHGKPRVGPDGTVYLPNKDCSAQGGPTAAKGVIISKDNGVTWVVHTIPNTGVDGNQSDSDVAVGGSSGPGTVYYGYRDGDHKAKVVVSTDEGDHWSNPIDIGAAFGIQNVQFPEVIAGDQNRAAVTFIGTTTPSTSTGGQGDRGDDVSDNFGCPANQSTGCGAVWNLYVAFTYDGGQTWQTVDALPNLPVQRGGVCMNGTGCTGNDRNMLDFNDETVDRFGRVHIAYTDGCSGACETDPSAGTCPQGSGTCTGKFSSLFSVVRQTCGLGLFSDNDPGFNEDVACATLTTTNVAEAPLTGLFGVGGIAVAILATVVAGRRRRTRRHSPPTI